MLVALYEIRNNRNVGHVGGEVDPNHVDGLSVLQMAKWIVAELVRVLHLLPVDEAADLVEALAERHVPLVWRVNGQRRVLDPSLSMKDKTLLILHGCSGVTSEADIFRWVEHDRASWYRRDVLKPAHKAKLIEHDRNAMQCTCRQQASRGSCCGPPSSTNSTHGTAELPTQTAEKP